MEFWADVLFEKPKSASQLPATASPIIWGYEADHPFDEESANVFSCGLNYSIAPGTATWRSFSGRWNTVWENLSLPLENAKKHKRMVSFLPLGEIVETINLGQHCTLPSF